MSNEFNFDPASRRLRCIGHVISLIARAFLFGEDADALELELPVTQPSENVGALIEWHDIELSEASIKELHFALWRKREPLGKLNNIIIYIRASP